MCFFPSPQRLSLRALNLLSQWSALPPSATFFVKEGTRPQVRPSTATVHVVVREEVEEEVGEVAEEEEAPVDADSLAKLSRRTVRVRPGAQLVDGACVRRVVPRLSPLPLALVVPPPPVLSPLPPELSGTKVTTREWRRETDAATLWQEPAQHALPHIRKTAQWLREMNRAEPITKLVNNPFT